jgi:hypothetical protein
LEQSVPRASGVSKINRVGSARLYHRKGSVFKRERYLARFKEDIAVELGFRTEAEVKALIRLVDAIAELRAGKAVKRERRRLKRRERRRSVRAIAPDHALSYRGYEITRVNDDAPDASRRLAVTKMGADFRSFESAIHRINRSVAALDRIENSLTTAPSGFNRNGEK